MLQIHIHMLISFSGSGLLGAAKKLANTKPMLKNKAINKKIMMDK